MKKAGASVWTLHGALWAAAVCPIDDALAAPRYQPSEDSKLCLECHEDEDAELTLRDGSIMRVGVDVRVLARSVHIDVQCVECHAEMDPGGHDERSFANRRQFKVRAARVCEGCHKSAGMHQRMLAVLDKLVCTDCHGAHDVAQAPDDGCLGCHENRLSITFADGSRQAIAVHPEAVAASVHNELECVECHEGYSASQHAATPFADRRDLTRRLNESCQTCHFDKQERARESIHYALAEEGRVDTPVCVDCHGAHEIAAGAREKVQSARRCERCHQEIYSTYLSSVHGKALISDHNVDVPVCADCHEAHNIADPRTRSFVNNTPELCGNCHANERLMAQYGLSTYVVTSYLSDFHGITRAYYSKEGTFDRHIAVCTDCHGVHDIMSTRGASAATFKKRLIKRCQACHPDGSENFPDTWLSHYPPSEKHASLVYLVTVGYRFLIPLMIGGLVLQILLHIWRYAVKR